MRQQLKSLQERWLRRRWHADAVALSKFANLNPCVVVTGGSEGLGYALADRFARGGHRLLLVARNLNALEEAASRLRGTTGAAVDVVAIDLTQPDAVPRLDACLEALGVYVDVLVNNAGMGLSGRFETHAMDDLARLTDLNVRALTQLMRRYLPEMKIRGRGGVLNLASIGSYGPGPNQAAYYASKAYVLSLSEAVAHEVAGHGVRICAVAPGPVRTRFHAKMGAERAFYRWFSPPMPPEIVAALAYWGYVAGMRVVWPGVLTPFVALAMRLIPHRVLNVIVAALLKPRRTQHRPKD